MFNDALFLVDEVISDSGIPSYPDTDRACCNCGTTLGSGTELGVAGALAVVLSGDGTFTTKFVRVTSDVPPDSSGIACD